MKNTKLCVFCKSRIDGDANICPFCGIEATNTNPVGSLELGAVIKNKYTVGRFVSIDGEGITYEALVNATAEEVMVKEFLPIALCASRRPTGEVVPRPGSEVPYKTTLSDFIDLYKNLTRVAANPGLLKVVDLIQENQTAYAVTERINGKTLREYLEQKNQKIPFERAEEMLEPVFSGLLAIHDIKLLHRGVSPDTIYIKEDGELMLAGYATISLRTSKSALKPQLFNGYTAPEQYVVTEFHDTGTDIYAVAAVLYRMITGIEPQDAKERYTADNLKVARGLAGNIPNLATSAIHRALRLNIEERTATILQLLGEFESAPLTSQYKKQQPQKTNGKISPFVYIVLIMIVIAVFVVGYAWSLIQESMPVEADASSEITENLAEDIVTEAANARITPRLLGWQYEDILADTDLQEKYLFAAPDERYSLEYPEGEVFAQQPLPEEPYIEGTPIQLIVSLGPELVWVPGELYGMTENEAMILLEEVGIPYYTFETRFDDNTHPGTIMYSDPAVGEQVVIDEENPLKIYVALPTDTANPETTNVEGSE